MTIRHNTKFRHKLNRVEPAATDDIRDVLSRCEGLTDLQVSGWMIRVIANTGLRDDEFKSLRISDVDSEGGWLHIRFQRGMYVGSRVLPLRAKTRAALFSLYSHNSGSALVLGDCPVTRFDQTIRKLRALAPQFERTCGWTCSIRQNFAYRLLSVGIPTGIAKYCLGYRVEGDPFGELLLTREQKLQVIRRNIERFMEEL